MGAWIETFETNLYQMDLRVAPHVGAWIETVTFLSYIPNMESPPTWGRGLKP